MRGESFVVRLISLPVLSAILMKPNILRVLAVAALLSGMLVWLFGGAQIGFYKTYYTVSKTDPITELKYEERVDAFLPGIETLAFGFGTFAILILVGGVLENRAANPTNANHNKQAT